MKVTLLLLITILISCNSYEKLGNFKYDYFFIEVTSMGYKKILTDYLDLTNKNEIQIDFYLAQDDRPLINCELGTKKIITPEK